jgi:hypothetical protein
VMIDEGFGYPAIKRRLRQIAQADFPRTPFAAGVVQGAVKFGCEVRFGLSVILIRLLGLRCAVALDIFATLPKNA